MTLMTSTHFASVAASGTDWRDTSKTLLEQLETIRTDKDGFNLGFLYVTDILAPDLASILTLFKSVTGIKHWVGAVGMGVATTGVSFIDQPAISAMIGRFDPGSFMPFHTRASAEQPLPDDIKPWLASHTPLLTLLHGDPTSHPHPEWTMAHLANSLSSFVAGGLTSSRTEHVYVADDIHTDGFGGVLFDQNIAVSSALSQGCKPLGNKYTITRAEDHIILELDGRKPSDVFTETLRQMIKDKTGKNPDAPLSEKKIPPEFQALFRGDVHVAFPVTGSDTGDFLVRNIVGLDPDDGYMAVNHRMKQGDSIIFVHRDDQTVTADLSHTLVSLRKRVQAETGHFAPKGAVYISCVARALTEFSPGIRGGEMALVREIIGDIPLAGFYAGGEISAGRLYGYTGVLILFL